MFVHKPSQMLVIQSWSLKQLWVAYFAVFWVSGCPLLGMRACPVDLRETYPRVKHTDLWNQQERGGYPDRFNQPEEEERILEEEEGNPISRMLLSIAWQGESEKGLGGWAARHDVANHSKRKWIWSRLSRFGDRWMKDEWFSREESSIDSAALHLITVILVPCAARQC